MIKFTNNELNKAKAYAYHFLDQYASSDYYLSKCNEDDDIISLRAKHLLYYRRYNEAAVLLEKLVLNHHVSAVFEYCDVMIKNLDNFNTPYKIMQKLIEEKKCYGYLGLIYLYTIVTDQIQMPTVDEMIDYIKKAFECAHYEQSKFLIFHLSYLLDTPKIVNKVIKDLCYKFKIESLNYFKKDDNNKLYIFNKIERENEYIYNNNEPYIKALIFEDFDGVSALILGLYLIKNSRSKKTKFDSEAFLLFKIGHKFKNKLCSILYALSLGHEGIKDKEELNKAASILSNCRDIYSINIDYIPNSLKDTFNHLIEEFHIVLVPHLKNIYKIHPFFTGEN